jgi:RimJ/RimL family protein N-acetyltransferase
MSELWPLFGLELETVDLRLRPIREADSLALADTLPPDVGLNPNLPRFALGEERLVRATVPLQSYWRAYGTWSVEAWTLPFAVFHGDELIGTQTLEGTNFLVLRVVDSASFLYPEWRGQKLGQQMRRAVLALAFGELGAEWAVSSAETNNAASLGVSRALGYELNGLSRNAYEGRVEVLQHVLLTRERWNADGGGTGITIRGFGACRPMFGLDPV